MADDFGAGGGPKESGSRSAVGRGTGAREEQRLEDGPPLALVEVAGRIKWFDVAKGFGFIVPDNGMPDVLLHVTCLRRPKGARTESLPSTKISPHSLRERPKCTFASKEVDACVHLAAPRISGR